MKMIQFLQGKKTYILSAIIVLKALYAYLSGDPSALNLLLTGLTTATLRAGVTKSGLQP